MACPSLPLTRRSLLAMAAAAPFAAAAQNRPSVGLEMFSVRDELQRDPTGTVKAVAKMGYESCEFYAPYMEWTPEQTREMRKVLDGVGMRCVSTHNGPQALSPEGLARSTERNQVLGSTLIVMAGAGHVEGIDGWRRVAETLSRAAEKLKLLGMRAGYHNHDMEFKLLQGQRPIEVLASNTPSDVVLQLDVGSCVHSGTDPVAWIEKNPGRIRSMHCKEWSPAPERGYQTILGEGPAPWPRIFVAAEKTGGIENYLIEQEDSRYQPLEVVQRCLTAFRRLHGGR